MWNVESGMWNCCHTPLRSAGVPPVSIRAGRSTPFRSALIPNIRNSRSLLIDRCGGVPPLSIRGGRSTPFRSALIPNIRNSRSLLIDRCGAVPALSIRGGVPPLSIRGGRSTPFRSALIPNIHYSRSLLIDRCGGVPPLSIRGGRSTPFRSALIPNIRNSRSLLIDRCGGVPPLSIRAGRSTPFRSALIPNIRNSRSLLIDRCSFDSDVMQVYPMRNYHFRHTGVLFPVAFIQNAGNKASLRVQSERSGGVPPLSIRAGRSTPFRSALIPNIHYSRSLLIDRCGFDSDVLQVYPMRNYHFRHAGGANDYVN